MKLFLMAVGLMLIFEGLTPFLAPKMWRQMMQNAILQNDNTLRLIGFVSMLIGLGLLYFLR